MSRSTDLILKCAGLVLMTAGMKAFGAQLGPIFLGLVLTIAVSPIQAWARDKGWPGWAGLGLALLAGYGGLLALVLALSWSVARVASLLSSGEYSENLDALQQQINDQLNDWNVDTSALDEEVGGAINLDSILSSVRVALNQARSLGSTIGLLLVTMFFMATDTPAMGRQLNRLAADHPNISVAMRGFADRTRQYLWVSTVFGLIVAVLDGLALWMMGIPLVGVWVLISFITNYIPNVGFILGVVPPALVGLLEGGFSTMVWVIVIYTLLNFVIQTLIQPRFVGDTAGLSTTLTFVSLIFWAYVVGPIGAFLAVPLSMLAKALLIDADPTMRAFEPFVTLDDPEEFEQEEQQVRTEEPTPPEDPSAERDDAPAPQ